MGDTKESFFAAMRRFASSVCVVTTNGVGGQIGVTVSAMTSVSADPPTVLVCVKADNLAAEAIRANKVFCVNILRESQGRISDVFAGRSPEMNDDRFACASWKELSTGSPILCGCAASLDCGLIREDIVGSHSIFIGRVIDTMIGEKNSLVYYDQGYRRVETV